jgi:hypothetical protein
MKVLSIAALVWLLGEGVWGIPFTPYEVPHFGDGGTAGGTKLLLKRAEVSREVHIEIARVQAVNRAFKKFSKRSISTRRVF